MRPSAKPSLSAPILKIVSAGKTQSLTVSEAFGVAHASLMKGQLDRAAKILDWLKEPLADDPRLEILRARCAARQGRYGDSSRFLSAAFADSASCRDVAAALHTILVYRCAGLIPSARQELDTLRLSHPELPSLWLLDGDLWQIVGRNDNARRSWRTALQRDYEPRLVTAAVQIQLGRGD